MAKPKRKGSTGKYAAWIEKEGLIKIEGWARDGLTDEQIAKNIGVARQTLYEWLKRFPVLSDTLKRGKEVIDRQVENALLKRALGYQYEEVTREIGEVKDKETGKFVMGLIETKRVTKEMAPDVTAGIFWLKNRKPNEWRDKRQLEHSGGVKVDNPLENLTTDELKKMIDKL